MRTVNILSGITALATTVAGHATFQDLFVNGKDQISILDLNARTSLTYLRWYLRKTSH